MGVIHSKRNKQSKPPLSAESRRLWRYLIPSEQTVKIVQLCQRKKIMDRNMSQYTYKKIAEPWYSEGIRWYFDIWYHVNE